MNLQLITVPSTGEAAISGAGRTELVTVAGALNARGANPGAVRELPKVTVFAAAEPASRASVKAVSPTPPLILRMTLPVMTGRLSVNHLGGRPLL
jgi:hypothetical protein